VTHGLGCAKLARTSRPSCDSLFYRVLIAEAPRFPELGRLLTERGKLPYLNRLSGYLKEEANGGRLEIHDTMRAARQFLAMISDQLFGRQC
jgi:TetR/AcrR family transcriptional regulator of autoinduction and epiphytic fitness